MSRMKFCMLACIVVCTVLLGVGAADAGKSKKNSAAVTPISVDAMHMVVLTQTAIIALNQANLTGNYSVLHDLAGPKFRKKNTTKELEKIFKPMRKASRDLSPIVLHTPKFTRPPMLINGLLRLSGFFPTQPMQVHFDLLFEPVDGQWKLYGVSVAPKGK